MEWPRRLALWGLARFECSGLGEGCVVGCVPVAVEDKEHVLEVGVFCQETFGVFNDTDRGRASVSGDFDSGCCEAQFQDQAAEILGFGFAAFGDDQSAFPFVAARGTPPRILRRLATSPCPYPLPGQTRHRPKTPLQIAFPKGPVIACLVVRVGNEARGKVVALLH